MGFLLNRGIILLMNDGILFIDKPEGMTSRQVDNAIGKLFHTRKVGHLGTLDPFATGLLIIGVNKGNKFLPYLGDETKTYLARLKLGEATSTGDHTGEVVEQVDIPVLTMQDIKACLDSFLGQGQQIPPMTSAIKQDGVALYKLAHQGQEVERKPRDIVIYSIHPIYFESPYLDFTCTVSSGTYIRVLGEDIAKKLGSVGHLVALRRTSIGKHLLSLAKPLEEITADDLLEPSVYVRDLKHIEVMHERLKMVLNGMKMKEDMDYGDRIMYTENGIGIAIYEKQEDGCYHCLRGMR